MHRNQLIQRIDPNDWRTQSCGQVAVLKFGGSVLQDRTTLRNAAQEIERWRGDGFQVVAVVSALAGETDRLLSESRAICKAPSPYAVAALVSMGELYSASLLGLHLEDIGMSACVLTPAAIHLTATGHPLDASPVDLDVATLRSALDRYAAVVVPGYVAQDAEGQTVLLGRGGSDLTALFLADRLQPARCRLIKDVDGLYDRDPAQPGPARRYATATWDDALATDGSIIQHKAVEFAKANSLVFELGRIGGTVPTRIGGNSTSFCCKLAIPA